MARQVVERTPLEAPVVHALHAPNGSAADAARNVTAGRGKKKTPARRRTLIEVRASPVHGRGVFALAPIPSGHRIAEYLGELITCTEADRRYGVDEDSTDTHTFLFGVGKRHVLDATHSRGRAKWINHSCAPNCEAIADGKRIFIETTRDIAPGEEIYIDYQLNRDETSQETDPRYGCRCGAPTCRGTMLADIAA